MMGQIVGAVSRLVMLPLELAYDVRARVRERRRVREIARLVNAFRELEGQ